MLVAQQCALSVPGDTRVFKTHLDVCEGRKLQHKATQTCHAVLAGASGCYANSVTKHTPAEPAPPAMNDP